MSQASDVEHSTPMRRELSSQSASQSVSLNVLAAELEHLGQAYDENYQMLSGVMGEVTDLAVELFGQRKQLATAAMSELQTTMEAVTRKQQEISDHAMLDDLMERLHDLEDEKQTLILERESYALKNEQANIERKRNAEKLALLSSKNKTLSKHANENLPMLTFVRRVLVGISSATIHKRADPNIIEGFISKDSKKDVVPFECDLTKPAPTYVASIWNIIKE